MQTGTDHKIKESRCLSCGKKLDGCTSVACDAMPSPGDVTICITCGHIMAFGDDLTLRELTDAEMYEIAGDERILAVQAARKKLFNDSKDEHK